MIFARYFRNRSHRYPALKSICSPQTVLAAPCCAILTSLRFNYAYFSSVNHKTLWISRRKFI